MCEASHAAGASSAKEKAASECEALRPKGRELAILSEGLIGASLCDLENGKIGPQGRGIKPQAAPSVLVLGHRGGPISVLETPTDK
jgi:hypothetical protein